MTSSALYFRLLGHVRPYWRQFAGGITAMAILGATEPAIPALLKPLLDGGFVDKDPEYIFWTPIILIALFLLRGVMNFTSSVAFEWVAGKLVLDLRNRMFDRILTLATPYFDANSTGNIIAKVTYNVTQVTAASTKVLTILVRDSIIVVGLIGYMLYLNWMLTILVFVMMPVIIIAVRMLAKRMRHISRRLQETMGDMTHVLEEATRGQKVIKIFGGQAYERGRFNRLANWVRRFNLKNKIAGSLHLPLVEGIGALILAILIYVGTHETIVGELTVGGFVSMLTAIGLLFSPIKRLTGINQPLQKGLAAAESVFALLDEPPESDNGQREIGRAKGRIEFNKLYFSYPGVGQPAIDNLNIVIETGTTVALVGRSGGGKTTIAHLIPRLYIPASGGIYLDGVDINELTLASLRKNISYVSQEPLLFNDTIAVNIAYGAISEVSRETIERAAADAYAQEFIQQLPQRFETIVGEDGVRLSGGQRQRIAIARALIKNAPVLLLDEATSALDAESEQEVQRALAQLTQGRTTLVIAHRLSTIKNADRILVIDQGRVVEEGMHGELINRQGAYYKLYQHQFGDRAAGFS